MGSQSNKNDFLFLIIIICTGLITAIVITTTLVIIDHTKFVQISFGAVFGFLSGVGIGGIAKMLYDGYKNDYISANAIKENFIDIKTKEIYLEITQDPESIIDIKEGNIEALLSKNYELIGLEDIIKDFVTSNIKKDSEVELVDSSETLLQNFKTLLSKRLKNTYVMNYE